MSDQPKYDKSVANVAEHFGVSERTVYNWLDQRDIPHKRVGGLIRFNLTEVNEWADNNADAKPETTP